VSATLAADPVTYYGCLAAGGTLDNVGKAAPSCKKGDTAVNWNQTGPMGPQGLQGPAGADGILGPQQGRQELRGRQGLRDQRGHRGPQGRTASAEPRSSKRSKSGALEMTSSI
jgi:hypothetical protein